jgi:serine protease SohB
LAAIALFLLCGISISNQMKSWIPFVNSNPTVAVVRLSGVIAARGRALNDEALAPVLKKAFSRGKPKAVVLLINSPGGSPVQSSLIGARIRRLSEEKNIPVYAFVEDVAASGGYWLASAADEIWADATSVVGSVGVISSQFGLHEFIGRHGIERRVYTAGKSKSMLDPFQPEKAADVKRLKDILGDMHETFKAHVTARRGPKLPEKRDLFTGEIWTGRAAVDVGLIDGIGHMEPKMKELFGDKVRFRTYGQRKGLLSRFGATLASDAIDGIEERAAFSRFGL